jgi:hypothetical protein
MLPSRGGAATIVELSTDATVRGFSCDHSKGDSNSGESSGVGRRPCATAGESDTAHFLRRTNAHYGHRAGHARRSDLFRVHPDLFSRQSDEVFARHILETLRHPHVVRDAAAAATGPTIAQSRCTLDDVVAAVTMPPSDTTPSQFVARASGMADGAPQSDQFVTDVGLPDDVVAGLRSNTTALSRCIDDRQQHTGTRRRDTAGLLTHDSRAEAHFVSSMSREHASLRLVDAFRHDVDCFVRIRPTFPENS